VRAFARIWKGEDVAGRGVARAVSEGDWRVIPLRDPKGRSSEFELVTHMRGIEGLCFPQQRVAIWAWAGSRYDSDRLVGCFKPTMPKNIGSLNLNFGMLIF